MVETLETRGSVQRGRGRTQDVAAQQLVQWLINGRLRLVDASQQAISAEEWATLPAHVRENALEDFQRVVRSKTKAAVLFVRA